MIRVMENIDLAQCGMIYAKAFPMEHWGIDWTAENATEYIPFLSNDLHCHSLQLPVAAIVNIKHCSQFLLHLLAERPAVV